MGDFGPCEVPAPTLQRADPAGRTVTGREERFLVHRRLVCCSFVLFATLAPAPQASAQGFDVTFFLGQAYPVYDEHLTLRPSVPSIPGVDVTVAGDPEIRADGGLVLGGAVAFELGILALEGRVDATDVGFDLTGARYDLRANQGPLAGLTGSVTIGDGRFDANRLYLLSGNLRLRTPGPIGLVASGGLSVLPDITISGSAPVFLEVGGIPVVPGLAPRLQLRTVSGESARRIGVNGGAGLRIGGSRVALLAEVRAFYFREVELRFGVEDAPDFVSALLESAGPVRFEPIIVNAQAGLVFKF